MNTKFLSLSSRFVSSKDDQCLISLFIFKVMNGDVYLVNRDASFQGEKDSWKSRLTESPPIGKPLFFWFDSYFLVKINSSLNFILQS